MKTRRRKKVTGSRARFLEIETAPLIQIEDLEQVEEAHVADAYVKLTPVLRAEERHTFDGPGYMRRIRERGAVAVVPAPRWLRQQRKQSEKVARAESPRDALRAWLEEQGHDGDDVEAAMELAEPMMSEEGL